MTIPTWAGDQKISSVYLSSKSKLSKYINWADNKPTHSLREITRIENQIYAKLLESFAGRNGLIVIGKHEDHGRALWEAGYELLNMLLQAKSLDLSYRAHLLNEAQKIAVAKTGIDDPVAVLSV